MRSDKTWCIVAGNIAGLWEVAGQNVVDSVNSGAQTSCQPNQDQKPAVDSLIDWKAPENNVFDNHDIAIAMSSSSDTDSVLAGGI